MTKRTLDRQRHALADRIKCRALMQIAYDLPHETPDEEIAVPIYGDLLAALCTYVETYQLNKTRPTVKTVQGSLGRLGSALAELTTAWNGADHRAKQYLYQAMGDRPFTDGEQRPIVELADAWARGVYRVAKFRDSTAALADGIAAAKKDLPQQLRRDLNFPGIDELTERLAELFTRHTGRPFTTSGNRSRKQDNATDFVGKVIATLPAQCRPTKGAVTWAMRRTIKVRE